MSPVGIGLLGLSIGGALASVVTTTEPDPLVGWRAFTAACSEHGGVTDYYFQQRFKDGVFEDDGFIRVACNDAEYIIPKAWYDAGIAERDSRRDL